MRAIGEKTVTTRYIGEEHVIRRYVGEQQVFEDYIHQGLLHHFDGLNNTGTGYDPNSLVWVDLVSGVQATLQNVSWQNHGVSFSNIDSKVFYSGQSVLQYTIFNTHRVVTFQGMYPRIFAERPYPTLYLGSTSGYAYYFYGQGKDISFSPRITPPLGALVQVAIRFGGTGVIDLFLNGVLAASIPDVELYPTPVSTMYIGCRAANDRVFNGEIYEHFVYGRPLSDEEIYSDFLVSQERYQI